MPTNLQFVPQNQFTFGTDGSIQITPQSLGIFDSLIPSNVGTSSYTLTDTPLTNLQEYMQQTKNFFGIGDDSSDSNDNNATALGFNIPTLQLGLGALNSLAGMYNSWNMNKLAKQQFNLQKDVLNTNLNNQIKSYNNSLADQLRSRAAMETGDANAYDSLIEERKLTR